VKAIFSAEAIGLDASTEITARIMGLSREMNRWHRPGVAELTGLSGEADYERRFLRPKADYTHATSTGSRGVWFFWTLEAGRIYEARYRTSWKDWAYRLMTVTEHGEIKDVTVEEVRGWLANVTSE